MANFKALKGQGHAPTLFMAFLYFDMSFMVWTMLGPLSTEIGEALAAAGHIMTAGEKATLLSLPILSGAILRIVLGFGVDKLGAKTTALMAQSVVIASLITAFTLGAEISYNQLAYGCTWTWVCRGIICCSTSTSGSVVSTKASRYRTWYCRGW